MPKVKKNRTFESETIFLPKLKMVLIDEKSLSKNKQDNRKEKRIDQVVSEDTLHRIIDKLSTKG
ncbi:MAG: hypothetical protein QGM50_01415 [Anaerolineae bacterium]|nr:hypothetical protein [Anaerolineae bacterium]MDK1080551.1 hypothetical protein [Anaerolineae bacterium]MDK1117426.1 hypothetical protein [Anaerolineae bacterium]